MKDGEQFGIVAPDERAEYRKQAEHLADFERRCPSIRRLIDEFNLTLTTEEIFRHVFSYLI